MRPLRNTLPLHCATLVLIGFLSSQLMAQDAKSFEQNIPGTQAKIQLVAIPAGDFLMGSPASEKGRDPDEGPQVKLSVAAFWMSATEITHDQFEAFRFEDKDAPPLPDAVSRPTAQYIDLTWGMGKEGGYPANSMQPYTAVAFCKWLWKKTGTFYRLPTEAEWEYACRAGSAAAYPWGNDPKLATQYAWFAVNAQDAYHLVGQKKPNAWGLYDMVGNVAEWTMDRYSPEYFKELAAAPTGAFYVKPTSPRSLHTARGGGFRETATQLRCADRIAQLPAWNQRDPQIPKSKWWLTDGDYVGFRIVKPAQQPTPEEAEAFFKEMLGQ
jgi:formylglycine-generating enzyme required for sulfatase activity